MTANNTVPFHRSRIAFLDTETTGLDWTRDRVIEIAITLVDMAERAVLNSFTSLINRGIMLDPKITELTGITQSTLESGPPPCMVWPSVIELLDGADYVCAYNAAFDHHMLVHDIQHRHMQTTRLRPDWVDPLVWVRERDPYVKGVGRYSLSVTAKRYGLPVSEAHRAAGDVETMIGVFGFLLDEAGTHWPDDWQEYILAQHASEAANAARMAEYFLERYQSERRGIVRDP